MATALHLLKGSALSVALPVIARQLGEPDVRVIVVLLHDAPAPPLPDTVLVRRLGDDLDYAELVDLIFASEHVIAW